MTWKRVRLEIRTSINDSIFKLELGHHGPSCR
jgi:hypothetical protein